MKFLILLLAVIALMYLLRGTRRRVDPPQPRPTKGDAGKVQSMVSCQLCGLHLPDADALPGRGGVFCSEAHRAEYEKQHPPA
jgi:uncharacterized protein